MPFILSVDLKRTATALKVSFPEGPACVNRYVNFDITETVQQFMTRNELEAVTDRGMNPE